MRSRSRIIAGLVIASLGAASTWSATAAAEPKRPSPTHRSQPSSLVSPPPLAGRTCVRQNDNDNGVGVISQNFERDFDSFDSRGADDFTLTHSCTVRKVQVNGAYFTGVGPAVSVHVTFYRDNDGTPGPRFANQNDLDYSDPSGVGNFHIPLASAVTFPAGTYWVAVRANIEFRVGGEWGWNTNNTVRGSKAQWKNHGDGFGTGCASFTKVETCLGDGGQGPDFSFALVK